MRIDQFMWGFQPHFRKSMERAAASAFNTIGFGAGPRAYLIGFSTVSNVQHDVCFESESDPLASVDLSQIREVAGRLYADDPESQIVHSYQPLHEERQAGLRDRARCRAIKQALEGSEAGANRYFFVGLSAIVNGNYEVHPILSFPRARWDTPPALLTTTKSRLRVQPSFQHALAAGLLEAATNLLLRATAPKGFDGVEVETDELTRRAAQAFTQSVAVLAGYEYPSELHRALDAVAAQPYEGRAGFGRLMLAADGHPEIEPVMRFLEPVPLHNTRLVRKALEMTGDGLYLLCDGEQLLGLGTYEPLDSHLKMEPSTDTESVDGETIFEFDILGQGSWEMNHRGAPLLRVINTRPTLPEARLSQAAFSDTAARLFPEATRTDLQALWDLADSAAKAEHGTMLVVRKDAAAEALRLFPQAQRIDPAHLAISTLRAVTSIDGAVLVDPSGTCHAVGVILDGHATGVGDAARGARYNSAVRYQAADKNDCLVVIVSEDGMIDLVPRLRRRIRRSEIEGPLVALEEAVAGTPNWEAFFRAWDHLETLAFYLNLSECERANEARRILEADRAKPDPDRPEGLGFITDVSWDPFVPDDALTDSYFLDEGTEDQ